MALRLLISLLVMVSAACSADDEQATVDRGESTPPGAGAPLPDPRTEVAGTTWRDGIVVLGGLHADGSASSRVHLYDTEAERWTPLPDLPMPLHHTAVAELGERLFVVGGYGGGVGQQWRPQAAVVSLAPGEEAWREEPPLAVARGALGLAAAGGALVAFGGEADGEVLASTEILRPGADRWEPGPDLAEAREHTAAAAAGGRVYAIAGRVRSLESNLASVESFAVGDEAWRAEPALRHRRGGIGAAAINDRPCVAGGEEPTGTIASVECLGPDGWTAVADLATPRHGLAVVSLGGVLHVIGGGPRPGLTVSAAHERFPLAL